MVVWYNPYDMKVSLLQSALLLTLVAIMSFGGVFGAGFMMHDGGIGKCPSMNVAGYCTMNAAQHLASWQELFAATLESLSGPALFPLLTFFFSLPFFALLILKQPAPLVRERWRMRAVRTPLQQAFARGILNSKRYSSR